MSLALLMLALSSIVARVQLRSPPPPQLTQLQALRQDDVQSSEASGAASAAAIADLKSQARGRGTWADCVQLLPSGAAAAQRSWARMQR